MIETDEHGVPIDKAKFLEEAFMDCPCVYLDKFPRAVVVFEPQFDGTYEYGAYVPENMLWKRDELIRDLLGRRCRQSCADCEHEKDEGCDYLSRALELGVKVYPNGNMGEGR